MWAHGVKMAWTSQGHKITRYFHLVVNYRRNRSIMVSIETSESHYIMDHEAIKREAQDYFLNLYNTHEEEQIQDISIYIQNLGTPKLSYHHLEHLNKPFTRFVVETVVFQIRPNSGPRPNGHLASFYQCA